MAGGTYTLLVELSEGVDIEVGALGEYSFESGWYAYVGSALGTGGFSRVERHRELAAGERDVRHWHIDYLLGHDAAAIGTVVRTAGVDAECAIADAIDGDPVPDFGCSDCGCGSHLFYSPDRDTLCSTVENAHRDEQPA
jgi:Uri superfamily endonuclease